MYSFPQFKLEYVIFLVEFKETVLPTVDKLL